MKKTAFLLGWILFWLAISIPVQAKAPASFAAAKYQARQHLFHDRSDTDFGTLYCGCQWHWTTRTGGQTDLDSCDYKIRRNENRAQRTEWEHIVPAWVFGHQRQCWQHGGRQNCEKNDPVFRRMEADVHNLSVAIGEVNADRSNYRFGMVSGHRNMYGACRSRTDFKHHIFEPRDEVKGLVARVTFYMYDRYDLRMAEREQKILMAWDRKFPVSDWERRRDQRAARISGHHNPFVTGEKRWQLGHKPTGDGLPRHERHAAGQHARQPDIIGHKSSHIYHLPHGCPSYNRVAARNRVHFSSEEQARAAGYRLAGNCH